MKRKKNEKNTTPSKKIKLTEKYEFKNCLYKIISGGQTGADTAALQTALLLGYETGGTTVKYVKKSPKIEKFKKEYNLKEIDIPLNENWNFMCMLVERSIKNVEESDGTIAFRVKSSPGTDKTIGYCLTGKWEKTKKNLEEITDSYKPLLVITNLSPAEKQKNIFKICDFISRKKIKTLNVCGHREKKGDDFTLSFSYIMSLKEVLYDALQVCKNNKIKK